MAPDSVLGARRPSPRWALSICATVLGSLPFGVVALVWSAQVDARWARGDLAGAALATRRATTWAVVAFAVQALVLVAVGVLLVVSAMSFGSSLPDQG